MVKLNQNTEDKILQAAEEEFIEKGMAGARMQTIADRAGINKSLLHYYYRSKNKLFQFVFKRVAMTLIPDLIKIFGRTDLCFDNKIRNIVFFYIDLIQQKPQLPNFILHELSTNPKGIADFAESLKPDLSPVIALIEKEIEEGRIRLVDPKQLIINVISLCVFPLAAKPMIERILYDGDSEVYNEVVNTRKTEVAEFIINALKP